MSRIEELAERYPSISLCLELNERSVVKVETDVPVPDATVSVIVLH